MNIIDLIKDQLGAQLARAAEQIPGVGAEKAQTAVQAAIPALLASFARLGSTPSGATALDTAAAQAPDLASVAPHGASPDAALGATAEAGNNLLSSLLGEGGFRSLAAAVASFAGLGPGSAHGSAPGSVSSLLGLVGSAVLGFLGRQASADEGGIAGLLASQKGNIEAALPAGLAGLLGSSASGDSAPAATKAWPAGVKTGAARPTWQKPVAIVAAAAVAALVVWELTSGPDGTETPGQEAGLAQQNAGAAREAAQQSTATATAAAQSAVGSVANVDVGKEVGTDIGRLGQVFGTVTDLNSANAAVSQVQTVGSSVDRLKELAGQLPADGRSTLAEIVAKALPSLRSAADRAYAKPGVAGVLKPVADPVLGSLSELAKNPA
jgi:hypothetical protein